MARQATRLVGGVLILVGAVLRLYGLGVPSLAPTEVAHIEAADAMLRPVPAADAGFRAAALPAPVPALITKAALRWGYGERTARLPGAIAGALTVAAVWLLGALLFGTEPALYATALIAASPLHVSYSRAVGPEAWSALLVTGAVLVFCFAVRRPQRGVGWVGLVAAATLACLSDYRGVLVVAALGAFSVAALWRAPATRAAGRRACAALAVVAAGVAAWMLYHPPPAAPALAGAAPSWAAIAVMGGAWTTADAAASSLVLLSVVTLGALAVMRTPGLGRVTVVWLVVSTAAVAGLAGLRFGVLGSSAAPVALVPYLLVAGVGLAWIRQAASSRAGVTSRAAVQSGIVVLVMLIQLPPLVRYLHQPPALWREAAAVVSRNYHPDDAIVALHDKRSLLFYAPDLSRRVARITQPGFAVSLFAHLERLWLVVPAEAHLYRGWPRVQNWLERFPTVDLSPGGAPQVFYATQSDREQLLREAAHFALPVQTLVHGKLLLELLRSVGPIPEVLWKVDQIALARQPLDLRNPDLLNAVYYLAEHGHGDRAASLAYRLATAEPAWPAAQQALAAFARP